MKDIYSKEEIITHINRIQLDITEYSTSIAESKFHKPIQGKWSVADNLEHLVRSANPLNLSLQLPSFMLSLFGKKDNKETFEEIKERYQSVINSGGKASLPFTPMPLYTKKKKKVIQNFSKAYIKLSALINEKSEVYLDEYCLPHPLIGKVSIREIMFFTIYHLEVHFQSIRKIEKI